MKFDSMLLLTGLLGCTPTSKERAIEASGSANEPGLRSAVASVPRQPAAVAPSASTLSLPSSAASHAPEPDPVRSAYAGCGKSLPPDLLWREQSDGEVLDAIVEAKRCAAKHGRRLLLEFVAPWCKDCLEMTKLDETPLVARILSTRFERVRINVGRWDRHEALRQSYAVRALATYIVIDPKTSKVLAQTTLEPITKPGGKLSAEDWGAWLGKW